MLICYYISSHGLGHATRSIEIITKLSKSSKIIVISKSHFIYNSILTLPNVTHRQSNILDEGVFQENAIEINIKKTWEYHLDLYTKMTMEIIDLEANYLSNVKPDLVLCDAPPYPCQAAHQAKIPCVLITNFTFDSILANLSPESREQKELIEYFTKAYQTCKGLIRLPGYIEIPSFNGIPTTTLSSLTTTDLNSRFIVHSPLVFRKSIKSPTTIRQLLNIPSDTHLLLITFGGFNLHSKSIILPPKWIGISTMPGMGIYVDPQSVYMPDLVNASDMVLGKCGYGICSEIVGHCKPLVYLVRKGFVEEKGLLKMIGELGTEMRMEEFESGNWIKTIELAMSKSPMKSYDSAIAGFDDGHRIDSSLVSGSGAEEIASFINNLKL